METENTAEQGSVHAPVPAVKAAAKKTTKKAAAAAEAQKKAAAFYTAGHYSGIKPSGKPYVDFEGIDVYLTQTADETFALVSRANGIKLEPVLVEAKMPLVIRV